MRFLHIVGPEALEVYNSFTWIEDDKKKLDKSLKNSRTIATPRKTLQSKDIHST